MPTPHGHTAEGVEELPVVTQGTQVNQHCCMRLLNHIIYDLLHLNYPQRLYSSHASNLYIHTAALHITPNMVDTWELAWACFMCMAMCICIAWGLLPHFNPLLGAGQAQPALQPAIIELTHAWYSCQERGVDTNERDGNREWHQ